MSLLWQRNETPLQGLFEPNTRRTFLKSEDKSLLLQNEEWDYTKRNHRLLRRYQLFSAVEMRLAVLWVLQE